MLRGMDTKQAMHEAETAQIFADLRKPFFPHEIEWRVAREVRGGKGVQVLAYLTARAVMERLDQAVGPDRWESRLDWIDNAFVCRLTLTMPDGRHVTRTDVCDISDIEPFKGAASGALKRAAVLFGVGRYLYSLGNTFADLHQYKKGLRDPQWHKSKADGKSLYWEPPNIADMGPEFAPSGYGQAPEGSGMPDEIKIQEAPAQGPPLEAPPDKLAQEIAKQWPGATEVDDQDARSQLLDSIKLEFVRHGLTFKGGKKKAELAKQAMHEHFGTEDWNNLTEMSNKALMGGLQSLRNKDTAQ